MIQGVVNARLEAVVRLRIRRPSGIEHDVDVIVDTGFSASLTLPPALVSALNLNWDSGGKAVLADGSVRRFDVYAAELLWDSTWRPVLVSAVGHEPLLGMRLLAGYSLAINVQRGDLVEIRPIP